MPRSVQMAGFAERPIGSNDSSLAGAVRTALERFGMRRQPTHELVATLNEVADAVSSAMSVEEVLAVIVERAKIAIDTDKAVLVLTDEHDAHLDRDTIHVRGRRSQHPQGWWEPRLEALGESAFAAGEVAVERHPEQDAWLVACPVRVKDRPIGLICAINSADNPFSRAQLDFLAILAAFASSAIENARLSEQGRYVMLASERDRIAREMHDGVVQSLFSISLGLELCKKQVQRDPAAVAGRLDELQEHLNTAMTELRRFIYDLRPMKLAELGMVGAIEYWIREITSGRDIHGKLVVCDELPRMTPAQEACLYRVAKEAVSNTVRHSGASSFVVRIECRPDRICLEVVDDGCGFDVGESLDGPDGRLGLRSIRERVTREGGRLRVDSAPGRGSTITVELPVGSVS